MSMVAAYPCENIFKMMSLLFTCLVFSTVQHIIYLLFTTQALAMSLVPGDSSWPQVLSWEYPLCLWVSDCLYTNCILETKPCGREGMLQVENLERKEQWSLPPRMYLFLMNCSCVDAGRVFTRGQVLPAVLPARSETVGSIGPFIRTCLRHLTFPGSGTRRPKKKGPNERTDQSSRKNTTKGKMAATKVGTESTSPQRQGNT